MKNKDKNKFKDAETLVKSPIPTRIIANGEYCPIPQTKEQALVEKKIIEGSNEASKALGISRRDFLNSTAAILLGLHAMNEVFGNYFNVNANEIIDLDLRNQARKKYDSQFVLDLQTHMIKDDFSEPLLLKCLEWSKQNCVTSSDKSIVTRMEAFKFQNYIKEIFIDSDTDIAFLSGAPFPNGESISNYQIRDSVAAVNLTSKSRLMEGYYVVHPHEVNYLEAIDKFIADKKTLPIGWKMFPTGEPFSTNAKPWRLDDEKMVYPFYEKALKLGVKNISIHKGLLPAFFEKKHPAHWATANVSDLEKAAKDWPGLNFIIFHSALKSFSNKPQQMMMKDFYKTRHIDWSTDIIKIKNKLGAKNIFAELGTSFASCAIVYPEFCAAFLGQLVNELGVEHVLWGTDSVFYGSPQWQLDAFRRFQIPEEMCKKMNWKINLGPNDDVIKDKILGLNGAQLYNLSKNSIRKKDKFQSEWILEMKKKLSERSNTYYGYFS